MHLGTCSFEKEHVPNSGKGEKLCYILVLI